MFFQVVLRKFDYFGNKKLDYSGTQVFIFLEMQPTVVRCAESMTVRFPNCLLHVPKVMMTKDD